MIKFSGAIIWTYDLGRLRHFYENILGLNPHSVKDHFIAYKWGNLRFSIGSHSEITGNSIESLRIMLNFDVKDIKNFANSLKRNGVKFLREPEEEHWGGWVCTFQDPDGNTIQLLQQPDH